MRSEKTILNELAYYTMEHDSDNYDRVIRELDNNTYKYKEEEEWNL